LTVHFITRFEPPSGREAELREELLKVVGPTRAESGCLSMRVFESLREARVFAVHSEWVDEAAFDPARPVAAHAAVRRGGGEAVESGDSGAEGA
jgi:quinol monooxygenase YgiN